MQRPAGIPEHATAGAQAAGERTARDGAQSIGTARLAGAVAENSPIRILPAFDGHRPPSIELIDECVHCGFCLPTCPTYALWGEEMDSPRGRIHLMKQGLQGEPLTPALVQHIDQCLGCLACVTACPSGVQYDRLIESTRQQIERRYPRSRADRLFRAAIFALFPYPSRLHWAVPPLALYQRLGVQERMRRSGLLRRLPARLRSLEAITPPVSDDSATVPPWTPAVGAERRRVALLTGCVQRVFFAGVNAATARVLAAEGCTVFVPAGQGCCGALSEHSGREEEALRFARRLIDVFERVHVDTIAINVAGCGSMAKEYGYLLRDDPAYAERAAQFSARVRDVSELVAELEPVADRHPLPVRAVYHDACHLAHGQRITDQPRRLLRGIPELELREVPRERELCCGSAGTYNMLEPDAAAHLGHRKASAVLDAGAQVLVTANPGCHLQITASVREMGQALPARHVIEMLDASIRGVSTDDLLAGRA